MVGLKKSFGDFEAVRDFTVRVKDGEFFVLLGPSGCGKTTALRMIAGLEMPTAGEVYLDRERITDLRGSQRDIAFVFQFFALYPHMNVWQNISFPLRVQGLSRRAVKQRTQEVAQLLQVEHLLKKRVGGLSSGDKQRVALGRAIVRRAKAFLMDEPLGALDAEFRELMCNELILLHNRINATTIYVTHDQMEAMAMGDRICVMDAGNIMQIGTPLEVYNRPRTRFVAGFIGSPAMNFLPTASRLKKGSVEIKVGNALLSIPRTREELDASAAVVGVRPENVMLKDTGKGQLDGEIFAMEYVGSKQLITVKTEVGQLRLWSSNQEHLSYQQNVGLEFDSRQLVLFNEDTGRAVTSDFLEVAADG